MPDRDTQQGAQQRTLWDSLVDQLRARRLAAGEPSYAEIAQRITERRLAAGESAHAARVARTTVYDAFRPGRSRVNLELVREIAAVLGSDDVEVDAWIAEARTADTAPPDDSTAVASDPERPGPGRVTALMLVCVAVNLMGREFVELLHLPIHLDMVGTAVAAIALGPWRGAAVGGATNLLGVFASGVVSIPFAAVNIAGALVWGYGVRRFGLGRTLARFFSLNLIVAAVCSAVAVPILVLLYDGSTGHGQDTISATFVALTHAMTVAIGVANMLVSVGDKLLSGFLALVAVSMLPAGLRPGACLPLVGGSQRG